MAAHGDRPVRIWARDPAVAEAINTTHANPLYLPNIALSPAIEAVSDPAAMAEMDALLVVTPAQAVGAVLTTMPVGSKPLVLCSKGIEAGTRRLVGEVARAIHPDAPIAVLSGPTFAHEVAAGLPTAVTLACEDPELRKSLSARIAAPHFRPYATDDVTGAEIGGAIKNVLAIGCGVVEGAGWARMPAPR